MLDEADSINVTSFGATASGHNQVKISDCHCNLADDGAIISTGHDFL